MSATVADVLRTLERKGTKKNRDGLARYAIVAEKAFGVSMSDLRAIAKEIGHDHELALALWETEWYEARMLASFVADPAQVTPALMDRWARDFDNWAICDTLCFHLFDKTPHALKKVKQWATKKDEFVKRASFALLASVALHDKKMDDALLIACLPLVEAAATDERNFVKKGVSWGLRGVGRRRGCRAAAIELAERLARSDDRTARWVGKDALRDFRKAAD
ncbi:MAG TPA: DNA alkylation repair protein [Thermoanaerobaculia bacterium]|nr:DNA alkylation repair protein [Thermoanaerobaculia bacterium]